jgi:uncharacterized protein (TIGR00303 family)
MIRAYSQLPLAQAWIERTRNAPPVFACILGFTETGLIPNISAAGATPADRQFTAIADAEFLYNGATPNPRYPLPPLHAGASPVLITRAVVEQQNIPVHIFDAGLRHPPSIPAIALNGKPARCVSTGQALPLELVQHLFQQGLSWGKTFATEHLESKRENKGYLILSECVVGGTTTALAVLTGLGWQVQGKVNSSHPSCNHQQKWEIVQQGLAHLNPQSAPLEVVAAVGDPMQPVVAGMAIAASQTHPVLLAGGTQMLAVYALAKAILQNNTDYNWQPETIIENMMIGTTRWVAEDRTGDTVGLANLLDAPLLATQLNFSTSRYAQLRAYEQGFVKEGVGAGGCAIAAHLYQNWQQAELLAAIEAIAAQHEACQKE